MMELRKENFYEMIKYSNKPVVVDFWADWCGPCKMFSPIINELAKHRTDINFASVDVEAEQDIAKDFNIRSIPNLIVFNNGQKVGNIRGAKSYSMLENELDEILGR